MSINYVEILVVLYTALDGFKKSYALHKQDMDKNYIELCKDLIDEIYKSNAQFFTIKEDNPF